MLLLGFKINFILVPSKTPEQNVVMHIIIKQLYSFINMTVIQTEYNSVSYQIKWYQLTAQSKFVHYFRVLWQTTFWKFSCDLFDNMFHVSFLQQENTTSMT